jgi:mitochondrial chaperone BCS1
MDVWVEFKNASRWQAEALFRNFFPCEEDEEIERQNLESVQLDDNIEIQELVRADEQQESKPSRVYKLVDPLTTLKRDESIPPNNNTQSPSSSSSSAASSTLWSLATSATSLLNSVSSVPPPPLPKTHAGSPISPSSSLPNLLTTSNKLDKSQFGATNTAYLPPPPDASMTAKMKPLDRKTLAVLAKKFADVVPEEEFSVAGLQGCEFCLFLFIVRKEK